MPLVVPWNRRDPVGRRVDREGEPTGDRPHEQRVRLVRAVTLQVVCAVPGEVLGPVLELGEVLGRRRGDRAFPLIQGVLCGVHRGGPFSPVGAFAVEVSYQASGDWERWRGTL